MYSFNVSLVLICMIITGAFRSVAVKLFYQLGFQNPLFVTLLYLTGQGFSLVVYWFSRNVINEKLEETQSLFNYVEKEGHSDHAVHLRDAKENTQKLNGNYSEYQNVTEACTRTTILSNVNTTNPSRNDNLMTDELIAVDKMEEGMELTQISDCQKIEGGNVLTDTDLIAISDGPEEDDSTIQIITPRRARSGSNTGLTPESGRARTVMWIHSIPWYFKPAIPGFFNLCNSAMRWGSLMYVAASTAEMLISGLELILSVFAARCIRKRLISPMRWVGVIVVALGLILVRVSDGLEEDDAIGSSHNRLIGDILISGQCFMSVFQDMAEELFIHESEFPATLLLGMEGVFGIFFGLPLYFYLAPQFGEAPSETWNTIRSSFFNTGYMVGLTFLFTATGIFNIMATGATSSMTRNIWKNFRTIIVWIMGLAIFLSTGNEDLGEEWTSPGSFFILVGFAVMLSGVYFYYKYQ